MNLKNDLILRAARGEQTERTPVWLMRQAGRVLPEYRAVREKAGGFKQMIDTPELAAEVTVQPGAGPENSSAFRNAQFCRALSSGCSTPSCST